ncbi:MAG: Gfo/Idh/MocA family oxidoreductase [Kiritimatiellia bacterium]|jgi:hypothetical protein|nr:Gfo/Idh/MocA family oxidoreductase [Kiritimatiellia bacterium]
MSKETVLSRRAFITKGCAAAGAALAMPTILSSSAWGKDGVVAPSERIVLGAIGIGGRGSSVFRAMLDQPDITCAAVCDLKTPRLAAAKKAADKRNGDSKCATYKDFRELLARKDIDAILIATGPNWHGTMSMMAAQAGKDVYCEKPCTKNIAESLDLMKVFERTGRVFQVGTQRRSVANFNYCAMVAQTGRLGKLTELHYKPAGSGGKVGMTGWQPEQPLPKDPQFDWHLYLGPAAWRPFNGSYLRGNVFEKGGGLLGYGVMEWGSHSVDQCQRANSADNTVPVTYHPQAKDGTITAVYANGVKMICRHGGWDPRLATCPVRFVGEKGWVETGDEGAVQASSPDLIADRRRGIRGTNPSNHVRDFFNCVKTRGLPNANHIVAAHSHIACSNTATALVLKRTLTYDPVKHEFPGDDEANRFRSEARREPWRV